MDPEVYPRPAVKGDSGVVEEVGEVYVCGMSEEVAVPSDSQCH